MRQWIWRNWWWTAAAAAVLAGCILNPQPEPPGDNGHTNGKPAGGGQSPSVGGGAFNVGVGGAGADNTSVSSTGGKASGTSSGIPAVGGRAASGGAAAAAIGGRAAMGGATSIVSDAGIGTGGISTRCPDDAGNGDPDAARLTIACDAASGM